MKVCVLILAFILLIMSGSFSQTPLQPDSNNRYLPQVNGSLKTKVEFDLENDKIRFAVRNARFGAIGKINPYSGYRVEIDLSDEGEIKMLDAFVKITPVKNLDFYLGQRKVPFGSDYLRNPVENFFANRSFVSKYVNDGLRDIGFVASYALDSPIPIEIWLSAMNGTGNNNPQWIDRPNYSGRFTIMPVTDYRLAFNFYEGSTQFENELKMISGEFRFQNENLLIESEYISRSYTDTSSIYKQQSGFYLHSYYNIMTRNKFIPMISPVFRYDIMGRKVFVEDTFAERLTVGINLGLSMKQFTSEIRLNYENYFKKLDLSHFDKFTIEFVAKF